MPFPQIPDDCRTEIINHIKSGKQVREQPATMDPNGCPNCGGGGVVAFHFLDSGPFQSVPTGQHMTNVDGAWYTTNLKTWPCPICFDKAKRDNTLWLNSNTDLIDRTWSLNYYSDKPGREDAIRAIKEMCVKPVTGWLTLFGKYGTGKTALGKIAVCWAVRNGIQASYTTGNRILADLRSSYGERTITENDIYSLYARYQLLVVDEVDRIGTTEWAQAALFQVLDARYQQRNNQATILITNQKPTEMDQKWDYLTSRMKDGLRIEVGGGDLRGRR